MTGIVDAAQKYSLHTAGGALDFSARDGAIGDVKPLAVLKRCAD